MLVNATNMLLKARDGHYGVGPVSYTHLEQLDLLLDLIHNGVCARLQQLAWVITLALLILALSLIHISSYRPLWR